MTPTRASQPETRKPLQSDVAPKASPDRPYDLSHAEFETSVELERLRAQADLFWPKESPLYGRWGLATASWVLELGSGPGFVTENLCRDYGHAKATCLEVDPAMVEHARARFAASPRANIVCGSAEAIPFADNSFDFVFARFLFQHLTDPAKVAAEALRVLRPGGTFVACDIDLGLGPVVSPQFHGYETVRAKHEAFMKERGSHRMIGRQLWPILRQVGFSELDLEIVAQHSDEIGKEPFLQQFDPRSFAPLVSLGVLSSEDVAAAERDHEAFRSDPNAYAMIPVVAVRGRKSLAAQG